MPRSRPCPGARPHQGSQVARSSLAQTWAVSVIAFIAPRPEAFAEIEKVVGIGGGLDRPQTRQVLAENPQMMVVAFRFDSGAQGSLHSHPHVQATYVRSGRFRFTVAGKAVEIGAGDSIVIPPDAVHGCLCIEPGELIDTFAPRRDDFL